ncbi:velvet factor-domain-containing protein [Lipomyces tetrasporus]
MRKLGKHKRPWTVGDSGVSTQENDTAGASRSKMAISNLIDHSHPPHPGSTIPTPKLELSHQTQTCARVPIAVLRRGVRIEDYALDVRQQPILGEAVGESGTLHAGRKAVYPPPVVQLSIHDGDPLCDWLHSSSFVMCASIYDPTIDIPVSLPPNITLAGTLVSSFHHVHNEMGREEGHFIFDDISIKFAGQFRLQFNLFEFLEGGHVEVIKSILSEVFTVYSSQQYPELLKSTILSRRSSQSIVCRRFRKETCTSTVLMDYDTEAVVQQAPRDARSESTMDVSTALPSLTTTITTVAQSVMPKKHVYTMDTRESHGTGHAGPSLKDSGLSAVSNSSAYGYPVSLSSESAATSNSSGRRARLGAAKGGLQKRHDFYSRKNTSNDRWKEFTAKLSLYSPRHEHQYFTPTARSPLLSPALSRIDYPLSLMSPDISFLAK